MWFLAILYLDHRRQKKVAVPVSVFCTRGWVCECVPTWVGVILLCNRCSLGKLWMNPFIFKNGIWNDKCPEGGKMICYLKENCGAMLMWNDGYFLLFQKRLYWGRICMQKKVHLFLRVWLDAVWQMYTFRATTQSAYRKLPSFSKVPLDLFIVVVFLFLLDI